MKLRGCFVAITTPFASENIDEASLAAHAVWLADNGVSGIVVCGTTGESATMADAEKIRAMQVVREAVGRRVLVIGGAGNNSTSESLAFVERVNREADVDLIMSVVPYYIKPPQEGIVAHFEAIANVSRFPVILYNVPGRTVVSMTNETMIAVCRHANVVAIKEASANLHQNTHLIAALRDTGISLLSGDDVTAMPFIALGGHGVISVVGNVAPRLLSDICALTAQARLEEAQPLNFRLAQLHDLMFSDASPMPAKAVVSWLGFGDGRPRLPLVPMKADRAAQLIEKCAALGVAR